MTQKNDQQSEIDALLHKAWTACYESGNDEAGEAIAKAQELLQAALDRPSIRAAALEEALIKDLEFAIALASKTYPDRAEAISKRLAAIRSLSSQPAQEAQSERPELTVWYGPMPESNGKSNFTAILMRKDGDKWDNMTDGITIDRSEYPDRVRYEADRVRYLIGELAERPFILDYDADKHSGYVASSQPAQDGWVIPDGLIERVEAAARRIENGHSPRRIPADPTDVDLVLHEVQMLLKGEYKRPFWIKAAAPSDPQKEEGK